MDSMQSLFVILSVAGVLVVWGVLTQLKDLLSPVASMGASCLAWIRDHLVTRASFFWATNLTFMAISAYHAAPFFSSVAAQVSGFEWVGPHIGLPVALVLDGVTIVFMQARLEANYKREKRKAAMYLRYVFASAGLNTIANLYTDIEHFHVANYSHVGAFQVLGFPVGELLIAAAPTVLSIFPMFLIAVSKAADEMVSIKPLDKMDVNEFRREEEKRVSILETHNEFLDREASAERRRIEIEQIQKENDRLRRGKVSRTQRAPKPPKHVSVFWGLFRFGHGDVNTLVAQALEELKQLQGAQREALTMQLRDLQTALLSAPPEMVPMVGGDDRPVETEHATSINTSDETNGKQRITLQEHRQESGKGQAVVMKSVTEISPVPSLETPSSASSNVMLMRSVRHTATRTKAGGSKAERAQRIIKKHPGINAPELAKKADISPTYARRILAHQSA